ncbi:MAG TPA: glycosyltransferase family 4 protein [Candidatus Nanoarchaeia archaeon]|nr:glycosyltransferase family 4 protein [Candidatus Nanoarchaeia archaeon]
MFGWELPPLYSGGLGIACHGLTKGLSRQDVKITFVLPSGQKDIKQDYMNIVFADSETSEDVKIIQINSILTPYLNSKEYNEKVNYLKSLAGNEAFIYGSSLASEVTRYTKAAAKIALNEEFDIIHCHDWMTFGAGILAQETSLKKGKRKPLIVQVHATEIDRTGDNPNNFIYQMEKYGMERADKIIAVSNYLKNVITHYYFINPDKIEVVHNAIEFGDYECDETFNLNKNYKIVLFLGRVTLQKGPDYFLKAAKRILDVRDDVRFVVAGNGDMWFRIVEESANLGIGDKVFFTAFLNREGTNRAFKLADLVVVPSVSEPFGIVPLEAIRHGAPVIVSKQSGVIEVVNSCLTVDFWDVDEMANKILGILDNNVLYNELKENGKKELEHVTWDNSAKKCIEVYNHVLGGGKW